MSAYTIRQFRPEEVELYRQMRLEALSNDQSMYGTPYEHEVRLTNEEWLSRLSSDHVAYFGLFDESAIIGITGIRIQGPGEGYMTHSYIRKTYRGLKLTRLLYAARIEWARMHGLTKLVIGHKETNIPSRGAILRHGFKYTHREGRKWPDGSEDDVLYYVLEI